MGINLHWLITGQGPMYLDGSDTGGTAIVPKEPLIPKGFEDAVMVPMTNLKVSAGPGEEWGDGDLTGELVPVPKKIAARYPGVTFGGAEVRGDSMVPTLRDGEPAIFARDYIRGNGVYVLSVHGDLLVKRLSFNQFEQKLQVISDNPKYPMREIPADMEGVRILGKVLIWVHAEE
jgi:phage repressor protein C with HTH and peptisase S24 domain